MRPRTLSAQERAWAAAGLPAAGLTHGLSGQDIAALLDRVLIQQLPEGAVVFKQDAPAVNPALYVVLTGRVVLARKVASQPERRIAVHGPLDTFGELSAFDPGPRTTSARCLTDTQLLVLSRRAALDWIRERPDAADTLLQLLARRLRRTQDLWTDLVFVDIAARLARALLELTHSFADPTPDGWQLVGVATQDELARRVGASRESVNRTLGGFQRRGWIQRTGRTLTVTDPEALWVRAGAPPTLAVPPAAHQHETGSATPQTTRADQQQPTSSIRRQPAQS